MKKRSWRWYVKYPLDPYALGPVDFEKKDYDKPPNERDVRAWARAWGGHKRLAIGFECWPTNEKRGLL